VETDQHGLLQAYARFRDGTAFLIVPSTSKESKQFHITIPCKEAFLDANKGYSVMDMLAAKKLAEGKIASFEATIPAGALAVFQVAPQK